MYLIKVWNSSIQRTSWYICMNRDEAVRVTRKVKACWLTHTPTSILKLSIIFDSAPGDVTKLCTDKR